MRFPGRRSGLYAAMVVSAAMGMSGLPAAAQAAPSLALATGPVSTKPAAGTPQLAPSGSTEQVRQLVQCGDTMYAVGTFTQISQGTTILTRNNAFSFSAAAPFTVTGWDPNVNGTVNSIAFNGGDCSNAYLGGKFSSIGGTTVRNIAEVSTSTGAVVTTFAHSASAVVNTLLGVDGHLLVGGAFAVINASTRGFFVSLNPTTGKDDGFLDLHISGHYVYPGVASNSTKIYNQQLSHSGALDLVEGTFTSAGGLPRQQIFMLDLATNPATVTGWSSPEFDGSQGNIDVPGGFPYQCSDSEPFYIRAASWSPDDSTVYIAATGFHPWNVPTSQPRSGLCDAAAAFPATQAEVPHKWINYTGCDSLYSTAADASAVYIGGHERWANNPNGCNAAGPGAVPAPGMGGIDPSTGLVLLNSGGTAGLYSKARGHGADDELITSAGLWIASDNFDGAARCDGVVGHAGICFLPY